MWFVAKPSLHINPYLHPQLNTLTDPSPRSTPAPLSPLLEHLVPTTTNCRSALLLSDCEGDVVVFSISIADPASMPNTEDVCREIKGTRPHGCSLILLLTSRLDLVPLRLIRMMATRRTRGLTTQDEMPRDESSMKFLGMMLIAVVLSEWEWVWQTTLKMSSSMITIQSKSLHFSLYQSSLQIFQISTRIVSRWRRLPSQTR